MAFNTLCPPALIYIIFSLTQIVIDTYNGLYNTAFLKLWVASIFTILLNYLCSVGLGIISWFMVFIPFILMTVIIAILLLVFGLNPTTGKSIIHTNNTPKPIPPTDYRQQAARESTGGYFDNYNDSNVNTIVQPTSQPKHSVKNISNTPQGAKMLQDNKNTINELTKMVEKEM